MEPMEGNQSEPKEMLLWKKEAFWSCEIQDFFMLYL